MTLSSSAEDVTTTAHNSGFFLTHVAYSRIARASLNVCMHGSASIVDVCRRACGWVGWDGVTTLSWSDSHMRGNDSIRHTKSSRFSWDASPSA